MGAFSISHWLVVLLVLMLVFGPKRMAELGKGLGQGLKSFKAGLDNDDASAEDLPKLPASPSPPSKGAD